SNNQFVMDGLIEGASNEQMRRNILLFKDSPLIMEDYEVTYTKDTIDTFTRTFTVHYKRRNKQGEVVEAFDLHPNILYDKSFTKVAASNPSTKRYWDRDIFTHIASLPQVEIDMEYRRQREDSLNYRLHQGAIGETVTFLDTVPLTDMDTFVVKSYRAMVSGIDRHPTHPDYHPEEGDIAIGASVQIKRSDDDSVFTVHPVLVLRGQLLYSYPAQINELSTRVRLNEGVFDAVFTPETELNYQQFSFQQGSKINLNGYQITFEGFNRKPKHPNYQPEEEDIAVSGMMSVQAPDGKVYAAQPVYLIRGNRPFNLKDEIPELGLHFRFTGIDPATETIEMMIAQADPKPMVIPFEVATNSLRSDYIVLEAIEFPGINLFWIGASLMMIGLLVSMFFRIGQVSVRRSVGL
nr:cytochrome c assembly protein [Saprospiraceae bacterium]